MPSLAEQAAAARRGERVRGGTEVAAGEAGTETYYDPQSRSYKTRPTVTTREEQAGKEEATPGLATVLAKRKKQKVAETETSPTGGGGFSGAEHARRAGVGPGGGAAPPPRGRTPQAGAQGKPYETPPRGTGAAGGRTRG
jgi:hypothetical protein